jgi:hypothetical protein
MSNCGDDGVTGSNSPLFIGNSDFFRVNYDKTIVKAAGIFADFLHDTFSVSMTKKNRFNPLFTINTKTLFSNLVNHILPSYNSPPGKLIKY